MLRERGAGERVIFSSSSSSSSSSWGPCEGTIERVSGQGFWWELTSQASFFFFFPFPFGFFFFLPNAGSMRATSYDDSARTKGASRPMMSVRLHIKEFALDSENFYD